MAALLVLATGLLADPAWASRVVDVRVGNHPTYTRVVFELDSPTGYRIERHNEEGVSEILVTMEAGSTPRSVNRKTVMVERVAVQDGRDRSVAHIRLNKQPSRVREMILSDPPRLVFDLVFPESQLAAIRARAAAKAAEKAKASETAEPTQVAQAAQGAEQAKTGEAARKMEEAKAHESARKAEQAKAREVARKAEEVRARKEAREIDEAKARQAARQADEAKAREVARKADEAKAREVARKADEAKAREVARKADEAKAREVARQADEAKAREVARQADEAKAREVARQAEEAKAEEVSRKADEARAAEQATVLAAEQVKAREAVPGQAAEPGELVKQIAELSKPAPAREKPAARPESKPSPVAPAAQPTGDSLLSGIDWGVVGGAAAGVLFVAVLFVLWLRRRSLPNDMDVTALAESAGAGADASAEGVTWGEDASEVSPHFPAFSDSSNLPTPTANSSSDISAGPGSEDEHEKENEMDSETPSLPMDRTASEMPTTVGGVGGDVGRLLSEVERRVAQLETRLDESVDARERLERQVAAQAEELRVQRAAIARTQRALRSLNRGEEDQATEPAIREPSS